MPERKLRCTPFVNPFGGCDEPIGQPSCELRVSYTDGFVEWTPPVIVSDARGLESFEASHAASSLETGITSHALSSFESGSISHAASSLASGRLPHHGGSMSSSV